MKHWDCSVPELARVETVSSQNVTVRSLQLTDQGLTPQGKPIELAIDNPRLQHWDHAYAMTGYSAQGKTISEVIINAESLSATTDQSAFAY